jgi:hypothetical protein
MPRRQSPIIIVVAALGLIVLPFSRAAPEFLSHARALIIPGTTLVLTDAPVSDRTHSAPGFKHPHYSDEIAISLLPHSDSP